MFRAFILIFLLAGTASADVQHPAQGVLPDRADIPFELAERLIVVQATVNGVSGNFLLDSGSPTIILNRSHFGDGQITTKALNHAMPSGAGGTMHEVEATNGLVLSFGDITLTGQQGLVADLTHLAKNVGIEVIGLIGQAQMQPFQVEFDYEAQNLAFLRLGKDNQPVDGPSSAPELVVDMEMHGHVPIIPVTIGGQSLRMGLDSGAAGAMIFTQWQEALDGHYTFLRRDEMRGADTNVQMGDVVAVERMSLAGADYDDLTFRFNDIAGHQPPFDGLLGYEFFSSKLTAINFRSGQLLVWTGQG